jgi:DNA-binding beta-propeller fold protein YncE
MTTRIRNGFVIVLLLAGVGRCWAQAVGDPPSDDGPRYVVDPTWPKKPADCPWAATPGIAVDKQDHVYVFTRAEPPVQVYAPDGRFVRSWGSDTIATPHQIRIDHEGHVWVADIGTHTIQKFTPDGKLMLALGTPRQPGCDETHFDKPTDLTILPNGDVFVSDGYGNRRVVHFDKAGKFVNQWGGEGTAPGQFALPHSIAADSQGRLYVADRENARLQVFDTTGKLLHVWDELLTPWGLHVTQEDEIWVCGSSRVRSDDGDRWIVTPPRDQMLLKLNAAGRVLARVPLPKTVTPPGKPGAVDWVHGIALDSQSNIYVGDIQGQRVQKFVVKR